MACAGCPLHSCSCLSAFLCPSGMHSLLWRLRQWLLLLGRADEAALGRVWECCTGKSYQSHMTVGIGKKLLEEGSQTSKSSVLFSFGCDWSFSILVSIWAQFSSLQGKKKIPKKSKIPENPVWNKTSGMNKLGQICFHSLSQKSHYLTDISQGLFHISSNPYWCADEINTLIKYCGRHWGGDKTVCMKLGLYAHRLSFGGFWASNTNTVTCIPDLLGTFSNKIAMIEALKLPSPSPMLSVYVFFRIYEYRIKSQGFCSCWWLGGIRVQNIIRALQHAHCFCSACNKWGSRVLLVYFLYLCSLAEEGLQPGSWGRWALMA